MGQKFTLTESERNRIRGLYEQSVMGAPNYGTDYGKNNGATGTIYTQEEMNKMVHDVLTFTSFAADFIPSIGPLIGAGIGVADAGRYYQEGNTKMACVMLVLTSLPLIGQIPGVKELGKEGLNLLAKKLGNSTAKYTTAEVKVINGINLNKNVIHKETEGLFKRALNNATNKAGGGNIGKISGTVANIADQGLAKGINQGVGYGVEKTTNNIFDLTKKY